MRRPPRASQEPLFSSRIVVWSVGRGVITLGLIGSLWLFVLGQGRPAEEVRGITFFALLASILMIIVANLSFGSDAKRERGLRNRALPFVFLGIGSMTTLAYFSTSVRDLLKIGILHPFDLLAIVGTAAILLLILQLLKPLARPRRREIGSS